MHYSLYRLWSFFTNHAMISSVFPSLFQRSPHAFYILPGDAGLLCRANPHAPALFYENENRPASLTYGQLLSLTDQEATAAVLRDGVLSTGDLGFLDENGCLHITGRKKEILVLSDGTKIFLPEYEALLAEALPGRDFAAVLKEGRPALLIRGNPEERDELLKKTASVLKNMPRGQQLYAILFTDTPLPRTSAGKLKRKEIETMADTAGRSTS